MTTPKELKAGADAMMAVLHWRAANHFHADRQRDAMCSYDNRLVIGWAEAAYLQITGEEYHPSTETVNTNTQTEHAASAE